MKPGEEVLSGLYHTNGPPRVTTGSVLVTSPSFIGHNVKISRLEKDIRELVSRSEFHVSKSPSKNVIIEIVIEDATPRTDKPHVYAWYSGWRFFVGKEPVQSSSLETELNQITSLFVAGLVASEIFRLRFSQETAFKSTENFSGDLIENKGGGVTYSNTLDFKGASISWFGCGSISNYAVHALDGISKVNGELHLVDPSLINNSNSRKYIGLSSSDLKQPKAKHLSKILKDRSISAKPFQMSINEYARKVGFKIPLAISAIDSSVGRRDLQAKLPETILNGWTGGDDQTLFTGVGRHSFDGIEECLNCAYWTDIEGTPNFVDLAPHLNTNSMDLYEQWREGYPMPRTAKSTYKTDERFLDGYFSACGNYSINVGSIRREFSICKWQVNSVQLWQMKSIQFWQLKNSQSIMLNLGAADCLNRRVGT